MVDELAIALDGGQRTTALRYRSAGDPNARVVLAHGAGAGQRHPFIVNIARRLAESGVEAVTFNFFYMEQKRRAPDPAAALEHCFRHVISSAYDPGDTHPLFIGGKSMGGRIATHLAAQGERLDGVFALGYPLHPPGKPRQERSAHLPAIGVPVLIVQGERDAFGTPAELQPVIAQMKARVTLDVAAGGDHSLARRGQPAEQLYDWAATRIRDWIGAVLDTR